MTSQHHFKSFKELQALSKSNLREVTTGKLAEISLKALENGIDTAQVFKFWVEEILNVYNLVDFDAKILHNILCVFADYTIQIIPKSTINCVTEQCLNLIALNLGKWQTVLSKVDSNLQNVVLTISICTLRVLASYYSFLKNSKKATVPLAPFCINGLTAVFNHSQHFQKSILSVILDNPTYFLCRNITDISEVAKVMECLITVGKIVPDLDVRLTAEIWKTISKISSENSNFITTTGTVVMFLSKERPIQFLCEEIRKSLHDIYQFPNMNPEIVERILKICSFYLKLLIKFASDYSHQHFVDSNEVIITLITVLSPPENIRNTSVNALIKQHLMIGFTNLVSMIYKNHEFAESLCKFNIDSDIRFEAFFTLSTEVFKLLISEDITSINLYLTGNLIENIFKGITKYPVILLQRVQYESFVSSMSALIISICNASRLVARLEKCLIRGVLQNDLLLATICIDIWHTLLRFIDVENRYKYVLFWYDRCMEFPILSNEPRAIYAKNLLRNLFNILPKKNQNKFRQFVLLEASCAKPLILFGCDKNSLHDEDMKMPFITQLKYEFRDFSTKISTENYFMLLENLLIMGTTAPSPEFKDFEQILHLFVKLLKISINKKQTALHISCIIFITNHIKKYSRIQLINLVALLGQYWVHFKSTTLKLHILTFLSEVRQFEQSELLESLVKSAQTDSEILVRLTAQVLFDDQKYLPIRSFDDFEVKQFLSEKKIVKFSCRCYKDVSSHEVNPSKRLKMEDRRNDLTKILCDVNKFANTHKGAEFSTSDLAVMNEIKNIFLMLCNK